MKSTLAEVRRYISYRLRSPRKLRSRVVTREKKSHARKLIYKTSLRGGVYPQGVRREVQGSQSHGTLLGKRLFHATNARHYIPAFLKEVVYTWAFSVKKVLSVYMRKVYLLSSSNKERSPTNDLRCYGVFDAYSRTLSSWQQNLASASLSLPPTPSTSLLLFSPPPPKVRYSLCTPQPLFFIPVRGVDSTKPLYAAPFGSLLFGVASPDLCRTLELPCGPASRR